MRIFYLSEMRKMNGKLQYHQSTECFGRGEGRGSRKQEMKARERSEGLKRNLIPAVPSRKNENFLTKYSPRVPNRLKKELEKE